MPELAQLLGHALGSMKERFGQVPTVSRSDAVYTCAKPFGVIVLTGVGIHLPPSPMLQPDGNINAHDINFGIGWGAPVGIPFT